jgi:hypothetical protein
MSGQEAMRKMNDIYQSAKNFSGIFPGVKKSVSLTKEELCDKLSLIIAPTLEQSDLNKEVFVSNYIYISQVLHRDVLVVTNGAQGRNGTAGETGRPL